MQLPDGVSIENITESPFILPSGQSSTRATYRFTVGKYGPFQIILDGAANTIDNAVKQITDKVNDLARVGIKTS